MISVLALQNQMEVLRGEVHSLSDACVTSAEVERVSAVTEEDEEERTTTAVIKTEPKVSCVYGDCMHISYRLYLELPATLYGCTCETKI